MAAQSGISNYLKLKIWCGLLTLAILIVAAFLTSLKINSTDKVIDTPKPQNSSDIDRPIVSHFNSKGSSVSYIQLTTSDESNRHWDVDHDLPPCDPCDLVLHDNSIKSKKRGVFFVYAQVTFKSSTQAQLQKKSVTFYKNGNRRLFEGHYNQTNSVYLGRAVKLNEGDRVSVKINGSYWFEVWQTYWGAYELR